MSSPKRLFFQLRVHSAVEGAQRYYMHCLEQVFRDANVHVLLREEYIHVVPKVGELLHKPLSIFDLCLERAEMDRVAPLIRRLPYVVYADFVEEEERRSTTLEELIRSTKL
ncbi:hypothetical protein MBLNU457_3254t1 [Dothideomycetes sp. NU457]